MHVCAIIAEGESLETRLDYHYIYIVIVLMLIRQTFPHPPDSHGVVLEQQNSTKPIHTHGEITEWGRRYTGDCATLVRDVGTVGGREGERVREGKRDRKRERRGEGERESGVEREREGERERRGEGERGRG